MEGIILCPFISISAAAMYNPSIVGLQAPPLKDIDPEHFVRCVRLSKGPDIYHLGKKDEVEGAYF
jgi:hypothetical protein